MPIASEADLAKFPSDARAKVTRAEIAQNELIALVNNLRFDGTTGSKAA